ncbi:hypothetical protein C8R44DRAFT_723823 [Mycena epipterygia]|nr:hypothetical protein C8R44DRAFT_723823 [Mycena epipterygia]
MVIEGKAEELRVLEAYLPDLMGPAASGWIEIIYVTSIVELLQHLISGITTMLRPRMKSARKERKLSESQYVCEKDGIEVDMDTKIFEPVLLHLAIVLITSAPEAFVFQTFTLVDLVGNIRLAFKRNNKKHVSMFNAKLKKPAAERSSRFFLFDGCTLNFRRHVVVE